MTAIDEDQQTHGTRTAMIEERVQRGADGAARVEHVIQKNNITALDVEADLTLCHFRATAARRQVIPVERDVEHADLHRLPLDPLDHLCNALCQGHTAALDADKSKIAASLLLFHDLVRQADQCAVDLRRGHETAFFAD